MRLTILPAALLSVTACGGPVRTADTSPVAFTSNRISVTTTGSGPDVILVPGLASSRDAWGLVTPVLDDNYRVHLVQLNGFAGASAGGNAEGPILGPVTDEIARYIRERGLQQPAVIGHSMGGTLAMMLAVRHPGAAGRVMVVDMMPFLGTLFGGPTATVETVRPAADQMRAQFLQSPEMVGQMFATMTRSDSARAVIVSQARASNIRTVADAFHELVVTDMRSELPRITLPMTVLFVIPAESPVSADQFEQTLRYSYASVPGVRIVRIDNSNHFIQIDQPRRFVDEVRAFMQ